MGGTGHKSSLLAGETKLTPFPALLRQRPPASDIRPPSRGPGYQTEPGQWMGAKPLTRANPAKLGWHSLKSLLPRRLKQEALRSRKCRRVGSRPAREQREILPQKVQAGGLERWCSS